MELNEYDKVLLKDGNTAVILEILGKDECYVAEIHYNNKNENPDGFSTEFIYPKDILQVISTESEISKIA